MQPDRDGLSTTLTQRCLALFQLLPTSPPHRWLIAADRLEEEGAEVTAAAFREGIWEMDLNVRIVHGYCESDGCGDGYGYGDDNGYGYGHGDGFGYTDGIGVGGGIGDGRGDGQGSSDCQGDGERQLYDTDYGDGQGNG